VTEFETLARSFGGVAADYELARPTYPPQAVAAAIRELGLNPDATALDLAAGTGKLTRLLGPRFGRVIAVEPAAEMLAVVRRDLPRVEALDGGAEAIPLEAGSVDVVSVAQAFHWFASHEALREMARVLKPGGALALIWNTSPWESHATPWWERFDAVIHAYSGDVQNVRNRTSAEWMPAFEGDQPFEPLHRFDFAHSQSIPLTDIPALIASRSYVTVLPDYQRTALLNDLERLLRTGDAPVADEMLTVPYETELYLTRLAAA
jgi:ubiquinone/menaquinone biosynthesis C-methylase UbiE